MYRNYIADTVRLLTENLAMAVAGSYVPERYWDRLHPEPPDTRTEEEKFNAIIDSLGLKVVG